MKLNEYLDRYLVDNNYKITIMDGKININNYIEIKDFSNTKIVIRSNKGLTTINGTNLVITKMLDKEILITGEIISIIF